MVDMKNDVGWSPPHGISHVVLRAVQFNKTLLTTCRLLYLEFCSNHGYISASGV